MPPVPTVPSSSQTTNRKTSADDHRVDALAGFMERVVPDAITTSILLLVALFGLSLALGSPLTASMDAYYRGLWMLLQFTMQMTLILVLSLIVGATRVDFRLMFGYRLLFAAMWFVMGVVAFTFLPC
jgi:Short chain fatty acid transporter